MTFFIFIFYLLYWTKDCDKAPKLKALASSVTPPLTLLIFHLFNTIFTCFQSSQALCVRMCVALVMKWLLVICWQPRCFCLFVCMYSSLFHFSIYVGLVVFLIVYLMEDTIFFTRFCLLLSLVEGRLCHVLDVHCFGYWGPKERSF